MCLPPLPTYPGDQRSRKSEIAKRFPSFDFEAPFSEHVRCSIAQKAREYQSSNDVNLAQDQLWSSEFQESSQQQALRIQQLLNRVS